MLFICKIPTTWSASSTTCWLVSLWEMEMILQHNLVWPCAGSSINPRQSVLTQDSSLRRPSLCFQNEHWPGQLDQIPLRVLVSEASESQLMCNWTRLFSLSTMCPQVFSVCSKLASHSKVSKGTGTSLLKCSLQAESLGQQVWGCQREGNYNAVIT